MYYNNNYCQFGYHDYHDYKLPMPSFRSSVHNAKLKNARCTVLRDIVRG